MSFIYTINIDVKGNDDNGALVYSSFIYAVNSILTRKKKELTPECNEFQRIERYLDVRYLSDDGIIIIDSITIDDDLVASSTNGQYDLKVADSLLNFLNLYGMKNMNNKEYEIAGVIHTLHQIKKLKNATNTKNKQPIKDDVQTIFPSAKQYKSKSVYTKPVKSENTKDILKGVLEKIKNNTSSSIQTEKHDESDDSAELLLNHKCNATTDNEKRSIHQLLKIKKIPVNNCVDENEGSIENDKLKKKIEELERAKELTDEVINNFSEELSSEKHVLENFITDFNKERIEYAKEESKTNREITEFISEKESVYKLIYMRMFGDEEKNKNKAINLYDVPDLFVAKFPVFLYMDGKDLKGNNVRERLLDRDDDFIIYRLLYAALNDQEFIIPEEYENNDEYLQLVSDFINFVPLSFQPATVQDIMSTKNKKDRLNPYSLHDRFDTSCNTGPEWGMK